MRPTPECYVADSSYKTWHCASGGFAAMAEGIDIGDGAGANRSVGSPWTNTDAQNFRLPVTHRLRHNPPVQLRSMSCA
jgi:hypothetical protein